MHEGIASAVRRTLSHPALTSRLVIGAAIVAQLAVLTSIRLFAADPTGGDLCRDAVAVHRMAQGSNPYTPITGCGTLYNLPHPPAFLLLVAPFVLLPIAWGAALWDLVALGAIVAGLALLASELHLRPRPWHLALALGLLIVWPPLLGTLLEAQISPILFLLCTLAWRWSRQGKTGWAGAALGVAAGIRLFPALAVLYFAVRRDGRAVLAAAGAFLVSELLALPVIGVSGLVAYVTREAPSTNAEWMLNAHNVSLWGLAGLLFAGNTLTRPLIDAPGLARACAEVTLGALLVVLVARTFAHRHTSFAADEGTFLAYVPAMLLASPLTWTHYFVVLLLPIVVLAARAGWLPTHEAQARATGSSWPGWCLAGALACIWINDVVARMVQTRPLPGAYAVAVLALPTYALLALIAGLLLMRAEPLGAAPEALRHPPAAVAQPGRSG